MPMILDFKIFILNFYLKILIKYFFLFNNFCILFKKLSNFLFFLFFNIYLKAISFYFALYMISIIFIFRNIRDKKALKCMQYLKKNKIKLFIIFNKTLYFLFIDSLKL